MGKYATNFYQIYKWSKIKERKCCWTRVEEVLVLSEGVRRGLAEEATVGLHWLSLER